MRKFFIISSITTILLAIFVVINLVHAETKTIIKEYSYQANEDDSKNSSQTISLRKVKMLLLEELATELESKAEIRELNLNKDKICTLAAAIIIPEIVDETWDGSIYWLRAKIIIDPDKVIKSIADVSKNHMKTKALEKTRKRSEDLLMENERLKKELSILKGEGRQGRTAVYNKTIKELSAVEWFETGLAASRSGNHENSIIAYSKALTLNPKYIAAYTNRGISYFELGEHNRAIKDFDQAIKLDTRDALAYCYRGFTYSRMGDHKQAIKDYNMAIKFNPAYALAYSNRGVAYGEYGDHNRAMQDFDMAIKYDKTDAVAYFNRGNANHLIGNHDRAIGDYSSAIKLNPEYANAYCNRANAYIKLNDYNQAEQDLIKAARLGSKEVQDFLRSSGINW